MGGGGGGGRAECKWEDSASHELSLAFERTHRSKKDFFREKTNIYKTKKHTNKTTTTTKQQQQETKQNKEMGNWSRPGQTV